LTDLLCLFGKSRDRVNAKVIKGPRLAKMMDPKTMPFDVKRIMGGGFKPSSKREALMDWVRRHDEY
jgi:hypothetical protein